MLECALLRLHVPCCALISNSIEMEVMSDTIGIHVRCIARPTAACEGGQNTSLRNGKAAVNSNIPITLYKNPLRSSPAPTNRGPLLIATGSFLPFYRLTFTAKLSTFCGQKFSQGLLFLMPPRERFLGIISAKS